MSNDAIAVGSDANSSRGSAPPLRETPSTSDPSESGPTVVSITSTSCSAAPAPPAASTAPTRSR
jgi:hypothetical protein